MGFTDSFHTVTDPLPEVGFNIPSDYKNDFVKPGFDCIMDRIIHNDFIMQAYSSNCLIPVPNRLPIPAAMISNVVFILSPYCTCAAFIGHTLMH